MGETYLIRILGIGGSLAATVAHEVILHNIFGETLLLTYWTVHHYAEHEETKPSHGERIPSLGPKLHPLPS